MRLRPGRRIAGRFVIERFIAEGGMGSVYAARDDILDESIAIKFLSEKVASDPTMVRRFRREIQLARKVTHPNVCRLYDVYEQDLEDSLGRSVTVLFVTMELLEGDTLEERLQNGGRLEEPVAQTLARQMCSALDAAHRAGIVHRDFKSNNVMLVPDATGERLVVTDFGLARSTRPREGDQSPLTLAETIVGTADYMSPEQIQGLEVTPASDLYSLGVVLFEMVTGGKPYPGKNPMQILVKRLREPPVHPRDLRAELSQRWEDAILACMEREPKDRPHTAAAVYAMLADASARRTAAEDAVGALLHNDQETAEVRAEASVGSDPQAPAPSASHRPARSFAPVAWTVAALAAVVLVAFLTLRPDPAPTQRERAFDPRRLTAENTLELDPVLSRDGRLLVYASEDREGGFALMLRDLATDETRQLVSATEDAFEPAFLPHGDGVVYHSRRLGGVWQVDLDGGAPRRLTARGSHPAVSPDGRRVAFQTVPSPVLADSTPPALPPSSLSILDLDTGETAELTAAGQPPGGHGAPTWSPDGRWIAFSASERAASRIWLVPAAGGAPKPLILDTDGAYDPAFSPDGERLYFTARHREIKGLWAVDLEPRTLEMRGAPRPVAGLGISSIRRPTLSANGRLVYAALATRSALWQLPLDVEGAPNGPPRALVEEQGRMSRPAFSADGRHLAYDRWQIGVPIQIVTMELATGVKTHLTSGAGTNSQASWLDAQRLAYMGSRRGPEGELRVVDLDGATLDPLATLPPDVSWATVASGGGRYAFHTSPDGGPSQIWIGGPEQPPTARTAHELPAGYPVWAPDGERLAYQVHRDEGSDAWLFDLGTGQSRRLTFASGQSWPYSFTPDGERVLIAARRGGQWSLRSIAIDGGDEQILYRPDDVSGYLRYPAISPDGSQVVFERSTTQSDLFLVDGFL
ncbi:MAG: protein kinase [Acidobacteriota bacterium]